MADAKIDTDEGRERVRRYLRWYMAAFPERAASHDALATLLGVSKAIVTRQLNEDRAPSYELLVALANLTEFSIDHILRYDPPPLRPNVTGDR